MKIRCADPSDAPRLASLHARCFTQAWDAGSFARLLRDGPTTMLLAAAAEDVPSGFTAFRVAADESEILTLGVLPESRRRGMAEALLRSAMETAWARGARTMFLEVDASNSPALALYRKLGFKEAGRRPNYYRNCDSLADAVVLRCDLSAWESRGSCSNVREP